MTFSLTVEITDMQTKNLEQPDLSEQQLVMPRAPKLRMQVAPRYKKILLVVPTKIKI